MGVEVHCCFCEKLIESLRAADRKVEGFERSREQGGTNALRLRNPLQIWAHRRCVELMQQGIDPSQGQLM